MSHPTVVFSFSSPADPCRWLHLLCLPPCLVSAVPLQSHTPAPGLLSLSRAATCVWLDASGHCTHCLAWLCQCILPPLITSSSDTLGFRDICTLLLGVLSLASQPPPQSSEWSQKSALSSLSTLASLVSTIPTLHYHPAICVSNSLSGFQTTHLHLPTGHFLLFRWSTDTSKRGYPKLNSFPRPALHPCLQSCLTSRVLCFSGGSTLHLPVFKWENWMLFLILPSYFWTRSFDSETACSQTKSRGGFRSGPLSPVLSIDYQVTTEVDFLYLTDIHSFLSIPTVSRCHLQDYCHIFLTVLSTFSPIPSNLLSTQWQWPEWSF